MSSFSSNNGNNGGPSGARVGEQTAQMREAYIKNKDGDAVGNNWKVDKADFGAFLGYKPGTASEMAGKEPLSGSRVIELMLQKDFQKVGDGAATHGNEYRNMFVSQDAFADKQGRISDQMKDGLDAVRQSLHKNSAAAAEKTGMATQATGTQAASGQTAPGQAANGQAAVKQAPKLGGSAMDQYMARVETSQKQTRNDNMRMLEVQYKMQEISKQDSTISNLMKTRHDAVSRVIRGGQ